MKRYLLQIGSVLMALQVLLVAHGLSVNFHLCLEDHHMVSSWGNASELCGHCFGHHHHEHMDTHEFEEHGKVVHFGAKCCCEDFDSRVGFTDDFTFSPEKALNVFLPVTMIADMSLDVVEINPVTVFRCFTQSKIPYLRTGRLMTIFFSSLRLNPLVF